MLTRWKPNSSESFHLLICFSAAASAQSHDILFTPGPSREALYWVHLTWAVETDPAWPWTEQYQSLAEFADDWAKDNPDADAG